MPAFSQTAAVGPGNSATQNGASIPHFFGIWAHPFLTGFEPPRSGPGPVRNRSRRPDGVANFQRLVGDYTNPILKPHAAEIVSLRLKLRQAYEYEKGKGDRNRFTREQWEILADPTGHLLGGFLRKWETENKGQSPAFLDGISENVAAAFDKIIELESRKVKD